MLYNMICFSLTNCKISPIIKLLLGVIFLSLFLIPDSCYGQSVAQIEQNRVDSTYFCKISSNLDSVVKNDKNDTWLSTFKTQDAQCINILIDSLSDKFKKSGTLKYLLILAKISAVSDGFISEHLSTIFDSLCIFRLEELVQFTYKNSKANYSQSLNFFFVESLKRTTIIDSHLKEKYLKILANLKENSSDYNFKLHVDYLKKILD